MTAVIFTVLVGLPGALTAGPTETASCPYRPVRHPGLLVVAGLALVLGGGAITTRR